MGFAHDLVMVKTGESEVSLEEDDEEVEESMETTEHEKDVR